MIAVEQLIRQQWLGLLKTWKSGDAEINAAPKGKRGIYDRSDHYHRNGPDWRLALGAHKELVRRVGHDREIGIARKAEKMGALDKVSFTLPAAVREADLVILSLPLDQIRETLEFIAPDLKDGAVVMDTGPVKEAVANWAAELLPAGRFYVGLTPVLNPAYLQGHDSGLEAARVDLFRGGMMAIVTPPNTPSEAIKLAADLTRLLGASPFFADPLEMDGLMASTHILPQLLAAGLLAATLDQPGWNEGRKVAGRAYAEATSAILLPTGPESLRAAALLNQDNVLRVLDSLMAALETLRGDIQAGDAASLDERLARLRQGRADWWAQRLTSNWVGEGPPSFEAPTASEWFGRMLGVGNRGKEKKK
jgi:prephenate dehydrogenase